MSVLEIATQFGFCALLVAVMWAFFQKQYGLMIKEQKETNLFIRVALTGLVTTNQEVIIKNTEAIEKSTEVVKYCMTELMKNRK